MFNKTTKYKQSIESSYIFPTVTGYKNLLFPRNSSHCLVVPHRGKGSVPISPYAFVCNRWCAYYHIHTACKLAEHVYRTLTTNTRCWDGW